jgi:hypothetical protein
MFNIFLYVCMYRICTICTTVTLTVRCTVCTMHVRHAHLYIDCIVLARSLRKIAVCVLYPNIAYVRMYVWDRRQRAMAM